MQHLKESHKIEIEELASRFESHQKNLRLEFETEKLKLENRLQDNKKQLELVVS